MFISSTVLYFDESPVGYDLYKRGDSFVLKPAPTVDGKTAMPEIKAEPDGADWRITGAPQSDVQEQVQKLIALHNVLALSGELTAAM